MPDVLFAPLLLRHIRPPARDRLASSAPELEALLRARWQTARDAWPGVALEPADFLAHVGAHVPMTVESVAAVAALRLEELYLACACSQGAPAALTLLEAHYLPTVAAALARLKLGHAGVDEVQQRLRRRLFTREGARLPKIASYSGRGQLGAWLRAIAVRVAFKLLREERARPYSDGDSTALAASDGNAELRYFKTHYGPLFRAVFAEAVAALPADEKQLLGEYYGRGLTIVQMAARRDAHRVTVSRWLEQIRHRLLERTRNALMARMRVSQGECDSILRLVQSQFDLTFHRLLGEREA